MSHAARPLRLVPGTSFALALFLIACGGGGQAARDGATDGSNHDVRADGATDQVVTATGGTDAAVDHPTGGGGAGGTGTGGQSGGGAGQSGGGGGSIGGGGSGAAGAAGSSGGTGAGGTAGAAGGGGQATGGAASGGGGLGGGGDNGGNGGQAGNGGARAAASGGVGGAAGAAGAGAAGMGGSLAGNGGGGGASIPPACVVRGGEVRLTNSVGDSRGPKLILDGDHFVAVWTDARGGTAVPYAARLNIAGSLLAPEAPVSADPRAARRVSVSLDTQGLLPVWERITASGSIDVLGIPLKHDLSPLVPATADLKATATNDARPQVVRTLGHTYVAWMDAAASGGGADGGASSPGFGWVAQVADGPVLASNPAPVSLGHGGTVLYPAFADGGPSLAVSYVEQFSTHSEIRVAMFDADLHLVRDVSLRDHASNAFNPSLAWDGTGWVGAWEDLRSGIEQMFVNFVSPDGTTGTPFLIGPSDSNWPRVASNGAGISVFAFYAFPDDAEIMVSALNRFGSIPLGKDVQLSHSTGRARYPSVAYDPASGDFGVVWEDNRAAGDYEIFYARLHCVQP